MATRFLTILTGQNLPKIRQASFQTPNSDFAGARSGSEPEPSIIDEKTIADFTRVVEQTGILRTARQPDE
jgi:hypothetical protein